MTAKIGRFTTLLSTVSLLLNLLDVARTSLVLVQTTSGILCYSG